jgi:hypothetical protein
MENQSLRLSVLSVFAFLFLVSFASAQIALTAADTSFAQADGSTLAINVTGITGATNTVTFTLSSVKDDSNKVINFTTSPSPFTANGILTITTDVPTGFNFLDLGSVTLTATEKNSSDVIISTAPQVLTFEKTNFCYFGGNNPVRINNNNDLKIEVEDIQVKTGFGEDEEWFLFDEVEVEVSINNENDEDINNIVLEWGLYDPSTGEWVIELTDEDDFDLNDGDEETQVISFKLDDDLDIDLSALNDGELLFYVRVSGEDDNDDYICNSVDAEEMTLTIEDDFVMVDNIKLLLDSASCGSEVPITAEVWNIGSDDQDDVYVMITNRELGISQKIELGDIDAFENEKINAYINIPKDASEKTYSILFSVYDEDDDVYENSNDDASEKTYLLKVEGSCSTLAPADVSAELTSEAKAGSELTIKATIKNLDSTKRTFSVLLDGYSEWASSAVADKTSFELAAGASQEVLITIMPNEDTSGQKKFNLIVKQDQKTLSQPVEVTIEDVSADVFSNVKDFLQSKIGNNWYIWGIVALNVILLLAIIIVTSKIFKKK